MEHVLYTCSLITPHILTQQPLTTTNNETKNNNNEYDADNNNKNNNQTKKNLFLCEGCDGRGPQPTLWVG
jgi:hypothetical protein